MNEFYIAVLEKLERQENALNYKKLNHEKRFAALLLSDNIFIKNYRLNTNLARYVVNILTPFLKKLKRKFGLHI